jgi:type III restriction enzyme
MASLHEIFNNPFAKKSLAQVVLPNGITDNLKFGIRPYQEEAFRRICI